MFKKYFKSRLDIFNAIIIVIFLCMVFRLADLQVVKGDYYRKKSETIRTRNIVVTAPRGNIVDKYGRIIAGNKQSYSVNIMKSDIPKKELDDTALAVINIIEQNGDTYKDEIPILINPIRFSFGDDELAWKHKYNITDSATPQEAFAKLRQDYSIPTETIDVEAYDILKNDYGVDLPFDIDEYQYSFRKDELKWKKDNGFKPEATADEAFRALLTKYKVPTDKYDDNQAKKILAVKYLLGQQRYKAYEPVEIAENINEHTRAQIEENKVYLNGVEISEKPIRKYPGGDFASHLVGYMGKIGNELDKLIEKGYHNQDIIGKSGIEYSMEPYLRGIDGTKQIEIDVNGTLIDTIKETEPTPGDSVFLTTDSKLQKVAEDSMKATMAEIRSGNPSKNIKPFPNATAGALVAIDPNSGRILAMVSEPQFDPNLFAAGISSDDWKSLQPTSKDIYAPRPLVNNAISSPLPPGSTMKMATGLAGLEEKKIGPIDTVNDTGPYTAIPGTAPSCSIWKTAHRAHGKQNIVLAIKNSCNFYFFEVGRRLGGELFEKYVDKLGFGQYTGIDLPFEAKGRVEGPNHKKDQLKGYIEAYMRNRLKITDKKIIDQVKGITDLEPMSDRSMKKKLNALGITDDKAVEKLILYIKESRWQPGNVLNAAIGQGINNVTPLQLANYMATILNGGTRYKPYIVDRIIGYDGTVKLVKQPEVVQELKINPDNIEWLKKGMYAVANEAGGTAVSTFKDSKVFISGKTGTAEAGKNHDSHAWFLGFAPYDHPQIVVAVVIFQGGHGSYAAPAAKAVIEQYLAPDEPKDNVTVVNDIQP